MEHARLLCMLVLDTAPANGVSLATMFQSGLQTLARRLAELPRARDAVDIGVITYGSPSVAVDFTSANHLNVTSLPAGHEHNLGAALRTALDITASRKSSLKRTAVACYKPWVVLLSHGDPNDSWGTAADQIHALHAFDALTMFAVGVNGADIATLSEISVADALPVGLQGLDAFFIWLAEALESVAQTAPPPVPETVSVPPPTWASKPSS